VRAQLRNMTKARRALRDEIGVWLSLSPYVIFSLFKNLPVSICRGSHLSEGVD
jgi:hypothetical protein